MKKLMGILAIGSLGLFAACGSSNEDSVENAQDMNDSLLADSNSSAISTGPASVEDANWAVEVANAGMTEVELSKVAQTKATDPRLKSFAAMMVSHHTEANNKLKELATAKSITLPDSLSKESMDRLEDLNEAKAGKEFDREYTDDMLDGHKKAAELLEKGSTNLQDADLKNFAATTLTAVKMHQDSIRAISGKE